MPFPKAEPTWTDDYEHRAVGRFFDKVDLGKDGDSCWTWQGAVNNYGYGIFTHKFLGRWKTGSGRSRALGAHQYGYWIFKRELSGGGTDLVLDHLCGTKTCVNPLHMEMVESWVNTQRAMNPGECKRGHDRDKHGYAYTYTATHYGCRECDKGNRRGSTG